MDNTVGRYCTIEESLKQSCIEMKLMREGKLPSNGSWREMFRRIEEEARAEEEAEERAKNGEQ
ncbi:MAG: hypothetical protein FWF94_00595 [Oscillospiraceae bacterium]|nr:hypothetical protein [Oscillospiraceae bacterium]